MTTRRSFLSGILAAATPPGFVRGGVLMPVAPLIVTRADFFDQFIRLVNEYDKATASRQLFVTASPEAYDFYSGLAWQRQIVKAAGAREPLAVNRIRA